MLDKIAERVNGNAELLRRGRFVNTTFLIAIDETEHLVRIAEGRVVEITRGAGDHAELQFRAAGPRAGVAEILAIAAAGRFNDIFALVKQKAMRVEGDLHPFMSNLLYFKDVIAAPRGGTPR